MPDGTFLKSWRGFDRGDDFTAVTTNEGNIQILGASSTVLLTKSRDIESFWERENVLWGEMPTGKMYVLYDARAFTQGTDDAVVFDTADSEHEARAMGSQGGLWAEYDLDKDGRTLINERTRPDLCNEDSQDFVELLATQRKE